MDEKCQCQKPNSKILQVLDVVVMIGMVGMGTFIMVDGIVSIATK